MNRTYRLVWNPSLRVVQVASEHANARAGTASGAGAAVPRRTLLGSALLAASCLVFAPAVFAQTCPPNASGPCSAPGGSTPAHAIGPGAGRGGAGNGMGGGALSVSTTSVDSSHNQGSQSTLGQGGAGAAGVNVDTGTSAAGGSGGVAGGVALGTVQGGRGGDGVDDRVAPSGGGGGGAGVYSDGPGLILSGNAAILGGAGGNGGNMSAGAPLSLGAGGGGGGGAGLVAVRAGYSVSMGDAGASITGGAGGRGGNNTQPGVSYSGAGGGGGDGVLLFGVNSAIFSHGTISGGVGGSDGSGNGPQGGTAGASGAGIRALNTGLTVTNRGTIIGGALTGNGAAGQGIVTQGGATVTNSGTLSGGSTGTGHASAVVFNGIDNTLNLEAGSNIRGAIELNANASAAVTTNAAASLNGVILNGGTATLRFNPVSSGSSISLGGAIQGVGTLQSSGAGAVDLDAVNLAGALGFAHTGATRVNTDVSTTGAQSYAGQVNVNGTRVISAGANVDFNGGLVASGALGVTAAGNINATFPVTLGGAGTFTAPNRDITLGNAGNVFAGVVSATGRNVTFGTSGNLQVARIDATGATSLASAALVLSGDVSSQGTLTLLGDQVTQTGGSIIAPTLTGALTGNVTLANAGNSFGTLGNLSARDVTLVNSTALSITGNVDVRSMALSTGGPATLTGTLQSSGGLVLSAGGELRVGTGGTAGTLHSDVVNNGTLVFNRADTSTFAHAISGGGNVIKRGSGTLIFDGGSGGFSGTTAVEAGRLVVGEHAGSVATLGNSRLTVGNGAALGGHGTIAGNVEVLAGATLSPGNSIGTLTVDGNLQLGPGSILDFELGAPDASTPFSVAGQGDSVVVTGDLLIDRATLNISDGGGFGAGLYRLFTWGNTLSLVNGGFVGLPHGNTLQVLGANRQINLIVLGSTPLQFWNANGLASSDRAGGGSGLWSNTAQVWTDAAGTMTAALNPVPGSPIFAGDAGTVTVDNSSGAVAAHSLQFASDGYVLDGDTLTLVADQGNAPVIRVGDGSALGAGYTTTINNVLAGTAGLHKTDLGTLVLNGVNRWTGDTRISGGMVSVNQDSALGDAASTLVLDGGVLQVSGTALNRLQRSVQLGAVGGGFEIADPSHRFVLDHALTGTGALLKRGTGTLVLQGNQSYTGGTRVEAGTLQGTTESLQGSIVNNAQLVVDQDVDGTLSADVSGSGRLTKRGEGTVQLVGTHTHTGGTQVEAGALHGTTESLQGSIVNNAQLVVSQDVDGTLSADVSGSGRLTKQGAGTVRLTGTYAHTGGTFIEAGTLQGSATALRGPVQNDGVLLLDRDEDSILAATLSGSGRLVKTGAGILRVQQAQGFTGRTEVTRGTLLVGDAANTSAALNGDVSIGEGARLMGVGTLGSLDLRGTVAPGNSIGTLHVTGNATLHASSRFEVEVDANGQHDQLAVHGSATLLGGSLISLAEGAQWNPLTRYTVLTARNGVTGQFGAFSNDLAFLTPTLEYAPTSVTLSLARNEVAFPAVGDTANQRSTAAAIESQGSGAVYARVLPMDADSARQVFDLYSGEVRASAQVTVFDDAARVRRTLANRLTGSGSEDADTGLRSSGWATAWGHRGHTDGTGNTATGRQQGTGWMAGSDFAFDSGAVIGAAVGQARTTLEVEPRHSEARTNGKYVSLYGAAALGAWAVRGGATAGRSHNRLQRNTGEVGGRQQLHSREDVRLWQGFVEVAYASDIGRARLEPYLNYAHVDLEQEDFVEDGGDAALTGESQSRELGIGTAGLRTYWRLNSRFRTALVSNLGYQRTSGDTDTGVTQRFVAGGDAFTVTGMPLSRNGTVAEFGLRTWLTPNVEFKADYQGRFGSGTRDQGAQLTVRAQF